MPGGGQSPRKEGTCAGIGGRPKSLPAQRNQPSGHPHRVVAHAGRMVTDEGVGVGLVEILEPGALDGAADPVVPILEGGQRLIESTRQGGDIAADERTVDGHEVVPGDGGDDRPSAP